MNWDYKGIFPTGTEENANVFYGTRGIISFCGNPQPSGVITPASSTVNSDDGLNLEVSAINTLYYQWQKEISGEWENITGENSTTLQLFYEHEAGIAGVHKYRCKCTGFVGTAYTAAAQVTVSFRTPTVTATASASTITPPGTLNLVAEKTYSTSIQWQELNGEVWQDIEGATSDAYSKSFVYGDASGTHHYRAVVSGIGGTATSEELTVTISYPEPTISVETDTNSVLPPASATLTATYTNADNGIQWQTLGAGDVWENLEGETSSTLTVSFVYGTPRVNHYYRCVASGYGGTVNSDTVTIAVTYTPPAISITASSDENAATLTAAYTNADNGIKWQKLNGDVWEDIAGETNSTLTVSFTVGTPAGTYYYRCEASGYGGTTDSNILSVTITYNAPTATITSSAESVTAPGSVNFAVVANYAHNGVQWQKSTDNSVWVDMTGKTAETMTENYTSEDIGTIYYRCVASGYGGSTNSNVITIVVS